MTAIVRRLTAAATVARANVVVPERPDRFPRALLAFGRWGQTFAGTAAAAAARYPDAIALVDDNGRLTYDELWTRTNALAHGLAAAGAGPGTNVGILCRNHRGFVEATVAASKLGANLVFLNTGFAGPQLADVAAREGLTVFLHDDEFTEAVGTADPGHNLDEAGMARLVETCPIRDPRPPRHPGRVVILTSGTTGRPRGASRASTGGMGGAAALLDRIPLRVGDTTVIAAPLFHGWGLANLAVALGLSSTVVLQRHFDAEATLASVAEQRADVLVAVPVMLQRMLALGGETLVRYDTSSLRVVASSGSALGGHLAIRLLHRFGPVLYNVYGSTELAMATIATPSDLRAAPETAGRPALGVRVRILDEEGAEVPTGVTGRVFVGSDERFEGYTGGGGREVRGGLLSIGDLGHLDGRGRLFVDGREDDMIVSGGENVFPIEVEELLAHHPGVAEVAVVGAPDPEFGWRLVAFVVRRPGEVLTGDDVRSHVRARLARYKVPRDVVFLDELPRTTSGKVVRRDLATRLTSTTPEAAAPPRGETPRREEASWTRPG